MATEKPRVKSYYIKKNPYKEIYTNDDLFEFESKYTSVYADNEVIQNVISTCIIQIYKEWDGDSWVPLYDTAKNISLIKIPEKREYTISYDESIYVSILLDDGLERFFKNYTEIDKVTVQNIIDFYKDAFSGSCPMKMRQLEAITELDYKNTSRVNRLNELQKQLDEARKDLEINLQTQSILQKHILDTNKSED